MKVMGDGYEKIAGELDRAGTETIYLSSKNEVIGYYKQEYGSHWGKKLAEKIVAETGKGKVENIARRFRGSRTESGKVTPKAAAEYKAVGRTLPGTQVPRKDIAGKRAKATLKGEVKISDDKRPRKIDATLNARQASALRRGDLGAFFEAYGVNPKAVEEVTIKTFSFEYL